MDDSEDDEDMIFIKAREFLQIVRKTAPKSNTRAAEVNVPPAHVVDIRLNKLPTELKGYKCETQTGDTKKKKVKVENRGDYVFTPQKRRKLERIKAHATSLKHLEKTTGVQSDDEEESVKKMLDHMSKLPAQDAYSPPFIPMGIIPKQSEESDISIINDASLDVHSQQFIYLTSDKDLAAWKLLNKSPTKRNVFVGNLSYKVDQFVLRSVFETLLEKEQRHLMKVRQVDNLSGVSKGYGFVEFPCRRAAELAFICLQGFELYGREMQLGWGQENEVEKNQDLIKLKSTKKTNKRSAGTLVSTEARDSEIHTCERTKRTRWNVEQHGESVEITPCHRVNISQRGVCGENKKISLSQHDGHLQSGTIHKKAAIEWLTRKQRVDLIKSVCKNLRLKNVTGHLGVFSEYFEADNSRLQVTCSKDLSEAELKSIFAQFGTFHLTCIKSEGCQTRVNIQYTTSVSAENALKQLHGKIVKSRPLSLTVAEPR